MNENQKNKKKFRQSSKWKNFRKLMKEKNKVDFITQFSLRAGWNLHHLDLNAANYEDLNEKKFCCVNYMTHKIIHELYRYYKKDKTVLDRLKAVLKYMETINNEQRVD